MGNVVSRDRNQFLSLDRPSTRRNEKWARGVWGAGGGRPLGIAAWSKARVAHLSYSGVELVGGVHRDAEHAFAAVSHVMRLHGYVLPKVGNWGGARRYVAGTAVWSLHALLISGDYNAPQNPRTSQSKFHTDMPPELVEAWANIRTVRDGLPVWNLGIFWSRPDPMHCSLLVTAEELADGVVCPDGAVFTLTEMAAVKHGSVERVRSGVLSVGAKGVAVTAVQRLLVTYLMIGGDYVQGSYDHVTSAGVALWQKHIGVVGDGIWGPATESATRGWLSSRGVGGRSAVEVIEMSPAEAERILAAAYQLELGREPGSNGEQYWLPRLISGVQTEASLAALLGGSPEGLAYDQALQTRRILEVSEAVTASYKQQFGNDPSPKQLTLGMTKVTAALANAWG